MWNEICRSPQGGVNSFTWPKLTSAIEKVKFMDGGFLTLVFTFFKLFFIHVLWIRNFVVCLHQQTSKQPKTPRLCLQQTTTPNHRNSKSST